MPSPCSVTGSSLPLSAWSVPPLEWITNIARSTVLTIPDTDKDTGMIEIVYDSRYVSASLEDIKEHG
jgi:hypothetical protein